jgi:hypothetical protein
MNQRHPSSRSASGLRLYTKPTAGLLYSTFERIFCILAAPKISKQRAKRFCVENSFSYNLMQQRCKYNFQNKSSNTIGVGVGKRFTNKWEETRTSLCGYPVLITSGRQANRIMELIFFSWSIQKTFKFQNETWTQTRRSSKMLLRYNCSSILVPSWISCCAYRFGIRDSDYLKEKLRSLWRWNAWKWFRVDFFKHHRNRAHRESVSKYSLKTNFQLLIYGHLSYLISLGYDNKMCEALLCAEPDIIVPNSHLLRGISFLFGVWSSTVAFRERKRSAAFKWQLTTIHWRRCLGPQLLMYYKGLLRRPIHVKKT